GMVDDVPAAVLEVQMDSGGSGGRPGRGDGILARASTLAAAEAGWLALSAPAAGPRGLPAAAREARYVAALFGANLLPGPIVRFDAVADLGPYRLLYPLWGTPDLAKYAADALGDLPGRDRRGALRHTLLAYLETGGSHVEAAARLGIHRNTLAYRLKQVAMLTGRDPSDPSCRLLLHLALLAAGLPPVAGSSSAPTP
ncbi:MAG: helix-turn-helix domain-containing protein, partial [Chloroflexota bacterium]|nr:helix-turn-helix domain-containing protein [Chloroflexota bacterium]